MVLFAHQASFAPTKHRSIALKTTAQLRDATNALQPNLTLSKLDSLGQVLDCDGLEFRFGTGSKSMLVVAGLSQTRCNMSHSNPGNTALLPPKRIMNRA
jgi:hypothetical protein